MNRIINRFGRGKVRHSLYLDESVYKRVSEIAKKHKVYLLLREEHSCAQAFCQQQGVLHIGPSFLFPLVILQVLPHLYGFLMILMYIWFYFGPTIGGADVKAIMAICLITPFSFSFTGIELKAL